MLYATWQLVAGNDDPEPDPIGLDESEPDFSLTDEEAIARFYELDDLRVRAYEDADVTLVSTFATQGPFKEQVVGELRQLKRDDVSAKLELKTEMLEVQSNSLSQIDLQQVVVTNIRFQRQDE